MSNKSASRDWDTFPRVRLVAQPLSLGLILLSISCYFGWHMVAAYSFAEPWWLQLANLLLIAGFAVLFVWGMRNMLSLLQQVRIRNGEVELVMLAITVNKDTL